MTTNYDEAVAGVARHAMNPPNNAEVQAAQVHATLAVADELRAIKELLGPVIGVTGGFGAQGRAFIRVFDEAP